MIRPMTSNVSALSGGVANGHQAIDFVSSAPSKIPYGGFSPVRLQTRLTPRPPSRAFLRRLIGRPGRYLRPRRFIRSGTCVQSAPRTSDHDRESSGPWLPSRLYCPASSSLTMATSAPLSATQRLMDYSVGLRGGPPTVEGPHFIPSVHSLHAVTRTPVAPAVALDNVFTAGAVFAELAPARRPHTPRIRTQWVA